MNPGVIHVLAAALQLVVAGEPDDAAKPALLRTHASQHSVGIEWDIEGDANHNATCDVAYRRDDHPQWSEAMPLVRIDFRGFYDTVEADRHYNMLAGSVLFLRPGSTYHVRLTLKDPDGGDKVATFDIATRPAPAMPAGGRVFHVVPGKGGGSGTEADPFRGLEATLAGAQVGDTYVIHSGSYGRFNLHYLGAADKPQPEPGEPYVVWKAAGDGEVLLDRLDVRVSNTWLDGLTVRGNGGTGFTARNAPGNVVLTHNQFHGFNYAIDMHGAGEGWYIADNVIVGDKDRATRKGYDKPTEGEGVELAHTSGHVVCYNTISQVADGVSYPGRNCDIFGNDIFKVSDDGLEADYGYANVRMWGNRVHAYVAGVSFQPMLCGPWYLIRNQIVSSQEVFKMRICDRFVMINNTFIGPKYMCGIAYPLLSCISRNNIWYHASPHRYVWMAHVMTPQEAEKQKRIIHYEGDSTFLPNWKTDLDYDAFGTVPQPPGQSVGGLFGWYNAKTKRQERFDTVAEFSAFVGVEKHGIDIDSTIFENYSVPADLQMPYPKGELEPMVLTLRGAGKGVDAGVPLANVHDGWIAGKGPDLGAFEFGVALPHFGARDAAAKKEHAMAWVLPGER